MDSDSHVAAQPLAALLPYGCGVPLAGAAPCQDPYPFCPFGTFPLDKGNRPPRGEPRGGGFRADGDIRPYGM